MTESDHRAPAPDDDKEADADSDTVTAATAKGSLLAQMGGPMGMLDSGLPVVVFVIVNVIAGLTAGIIAALSAGVVIAVVRLVRHKPVSQAIGGLFAVGVAAYIAHRMGSARGYFLLGIWTYLLYGGVLALSVVVRWPLIGVLWEGLNGRGTAWRSNRSLRHRYDAASLLWVGVFAVRYVVQQWLYGADKVGWLAAARLIMGYPLFILAILATVAIVGTSTGVRLRDLLRKRS
ncbi:MAG: DUF3159 domain-containing protein [Nakamurella sp.]